MKKRIISGLLSALAAFGLLKGCSEINDKINEEKNSYVIELPLDEEEQIIIDKNEQIIEELETKIKEFNNENNNVIIKLDLGLTINEIGESKINYELLNEIIALYSRLDDNFKKIYYHPSDIYSIDFNYINLKNTNICIYITNHITNINNIIPAIKTCPNPSLFICYSAIFTENDNSTILKLIEQISEKNGGLSFSNYEPYNKNAFDKLMSTINEDWQFSTFSYRCSDDFTKYTSNVKAKAMWLCSYSDKINLKYKFNEGIKKIDISFYNKSTTGKNIYLEIPDSLETLEIDYDKIDTLIIDDIKNAKLEIRTENTDKINTFIKLGYFEYPEFNIVAGNYRFSKDIFTDYKIELKQDDKYIGEVKLQKDSEGNITGLLIIPEEKNESMLLSRTKTY